MALHRFLFRSSSITRSSSIISSWWRSLCHANGIDAPAKVDGEEVKKHDVDVSSYNLNGGSSYMRAAVFWEPNKPLTIEEFHMPRPKSGEILIKTKGNDLCFPISVSFSEFINT